MEVEEAEEEVYQRQRMRWRQRCNGVEETAAAILQGEEEV